MSRHLFYHLFRNRNFCWVWLDIPAPGVVSDYLIRWRKPMSKARERLEYRRWRKQVENQASDIAGRPLALNDRKRKRSAQEVAT